jgi:DNA-binding NarL/FixJ family response regulator
MGEADKQIRVLLVEDNVHLLKALERDFQKAGIEVLTATTLTGARVIVRREGDSIDAVALDLELPDGGGELLLVDLDQLERPPNVIVVTGKPGRLRSHHYDFGITVILKPFVFLDLLAEVHRSPRDRLDRLTQRAGERARLSPRQAKILPMIVDGKEVKDIAKCFGLSPKTVSGQITRIYEKTGCRTHGDLVRMVLFRAVGAPWRPTRAR